MTYKSARWANDERVGVLLLPENGPSLYVDSGSLYDRATSGGFGDIGEPVVEPGPSPTTEQIRSKRDQLLTASDWTQVADAPVNQAAWATYRQALRDITEQEGFPASVVWPTPPE